MIAAAAASKDDEAESSQNLRSCTERLVKTKIGDICMIVAEKLFND
jgi:hypothetical protein